MEWKFNLHVEDQGVLCISPHLINVLDFTSSFLCCGQMNYEVVDLSNLMHFDFLSCSLQQHNFVLKNMTIK